MAAPEKIDLLTPRQVECLRLVHDRLESKEIGRLLGISPLTVDEHLKEALRRLGMSSRVKAAQMLFDVDDTPQTLGTPTLGDAREAEAVLYEVAPVVGVTIGSSEQGLAVQEARAIFDVPAPSQSEPASWFRVLTRGVRHNDLTLAQRLVFMMLLIVAIMIGTGIAVVGMVGVTALLRAILSGTTATISIR